MVSGTVVEESKRTETSMQQIATVSTNGYSTSGSSSSTTVHDRTHSLWLSKDDGKEMEVEIPSHGFSVRGGHRISVAWGGKDGSEHGPFVAAVNHATGATWKLDDAGMKQVVSFDNSVWGMVALVSLAIALLCGMAGSAAIGLVMLMGPAEIIAWFCVVLGKIPGQMKQHKAVSIAVDKLVAAMKVGNGVSGDTLSIKISEISPT